VVPPAVGVATPEPRAAGAAPTGLYVTAVVPGGPAAQAGLQAGDTITEIEGAPATSTDQLQRLTLTSRPGQAVAIAFTRQGSVHRTSVTLGSRGPPPPARRSAPR
jgi:putative serine protease PepD